MSTAEIDRVPISQAQASSGLGRSAFYKRLGQAGIEPIKVSGRSFLDQEQLEALAGLQRWIDAGNDPDSWPGKLGQTGGPGVLATAGPTRAITAPPVVGDESEEAPPGELVLAELEVLERLLAFLDRAAERGWALPTSTVELLVGGRPRGESVERYGFRFVHAGQHGREIAWRVQRPG